MTLSSHWLVTHPFYTSMFAQSTFIQTSLDGSATELARKKIKQSKTTKTSATLLLMRCRPKKWRKPGQNPCKQVRHPNYLGELLVQWSWVLPAAPTLGLAQLVPYYLPVVTTLMLVLR